MKVILGPAIPSTWTSVNTKQSYSLFLEFGRRPQASTQHLEGKLHSQDRCNETVGSTSSVVHQVMWRSRGQSFLELVLCSRVLTLLSWWIFISCRPEDGASTILAKHVCLWYLLMSPLKDNFNFPVVSNKPSGAERKHLNCLCSYLWNWSEYFRHNCS
jgi:hypothetical protein